MQNAYSKASNWPIIIKSDVHNSGLSWSDPTNLLTCLISHCFREDRLREPFSSFQKVLAGEYFVAAELSKMGHIALMTLRNTEKVDIIATNADRTRSVKIQVKTQSGNAHGWPLNEKAEKTSSPDLFYVFVTLRGSGERPEYFVTPSEVVANAIKKSHADWLATPGRDGKQHRDNPLRKFDDYESYREKWAILGL